MINTMLLIIILVILVYPKIKVIRYELYFNQKYHDTKYKIKSWLRVWYCNLTNKYDVREDWDELILANIETQENQHILKQILKTELTDKEIKDTIFRYPIPETYTVWDVCHGEIEKPTDSKYIMDWVHEQVFDDWRSMHCRINK